MRRRIAAAGLGAVLGVLLVSPVAAAPPTSYDETLVVTADPASPLAPGGVINLVMSASYYPSEVAQHRTAVLELPEGVTFGKADNSYSAGPCVPDTTGRIVTCTTQDPVDERPALNAQWTVTANLAANLPMGEYITVKTTLTTEIPDPDQSNNVGSWKFFIPGPGDMSATVSAPPGPWPVGAEFDATITVRNNSQYRSPASLYNTYHPSSLGHSGWPAECKPIRGTMWCDFAMLAAGEARTFTVHIKVKKYDDTYLELTSRVFPVAPDTDPGNDTGTYRADLVKPAPTSSPTASPTPTGNTGGGSGDDPSLPITGAPAAALALTGLTLLVAGAGALLLARRRA